MTSKRKRELASSVKFEFSQSAVAHCAVCCPAQPTRPHGRWRAWMGAEQHIAVRKKYPRQSKHRRETVTMSANYTLDITHQQALLAVDMQRAFAAVQLEQHRKAEEEREKEEERRKARERMRRLRKSRREEAMASASVASSEESASSGGQSQSESVSSPDSAGSVGSTNANGKTSTICAPTCTGSSPPATEAAGATTATSSKKRKLSAGNKKAALITPHKPHEDATYTEHADTNDNNFADDDDDLPCFVDDDVNVEEGDMSQNPAASSPDSMPSAASPRTSKKFDDKSNEGKVGLVLIPVKGTNQIASFSTSTKYTYWPALIYSSYDAFESTFPLCQDTRQLLVTVARERMLHETNEIAMWTQRGIIPPIGTNSESVGNSQTVKVAILLGSDIPPCGMRSYPVFPREISIVRGGVLQKPQVAFKKNAFKNMPGYANNSKFQEAVDMAKQYKTTKDTKILASQKLR